MHIAANVAAAAFVHHLFFGMRILVRSCCCVPWRLARRHNANELLHKRGQGFAEVCGGIPAASHIPPVVFHLQLDQPFVVKMPHMHCTCSAAAAAAAANMARGSG